MSDGSPLCKSQIVAFAVGAGNFGGKRSGEHIVPCLPAPKRKPDMVAQQKIPLDQAALYRMSGDRNPIHIDPQMAAMVGHKKPILHGLCSLGFSVHHILKHFAHNDPKLFKAVKV